MGMFDDIIVPKSYLKGLLGKKEEKILKTAKRYGGSVTGCIFQTKDLENVLSTYKVYKQKLYVNDNTLSVLGKAGFPSLSTVTFPSEFFQNHTREQESESGRWTEVYHTGAIVFYNTFKDEEQNEWWFEFEFTFNNGKLDKKKLISCKLETTKEKKDSIDKMWDTEQEIFDEYRKNFKYRFFSWLQGSFQKITNWARNKHGIPLEIRKEAYEKSGRLKEDPDCLKMYVDT
tara:strand:+ start:3437 stop:4126 length:690 start_codon:yes stop_codon:yes gene_type:complete